MASPIETWIRRNRVAAAGAAVGAGVIGFAWLRDRGATPAPVAAAVAGDATTAASVSDLTAYQAGASAAALGLETGAALGAGALGLAGSVTGSLGDVSSTLATSQAEVAAASAGALADALAQSLSSPTPTPTPTPEPAPVPTPTPTPTPAVMCNARLGSRPSNAWGWTQKPAGTWYEWAKERDGLWRRTARTTSGFTAWVLAPIEGRTGGGDIAKFYRIASGGKMGRYVRHQDNTYQCPAGSR